MNALVMYDRETRSPWSQFLGQAVAGPLEGTRLDVFPVMLTTWEKWIEEHPDSLVLDKGRGFSFDVYEGYYLSREAGVIGEAHRDDRLPGKELVLGVGFDEGPKAYPHSLLEEHPVINDVVAGQGVVIVFDSPSETAFAYDRQVDGRTLTFVRAVDEDDMVWLEDEQTGTRWVPFTGQALDGELAGRALRRVHAMNAFWFSWTDFFPETEIYQP